MKLIQKLLRAKHQFEKQLKLYDDELEGILLEIKKEGHNLIKQDKVEFINYCIRLTNLNIDLINDVINGLQND